MISGYGIAKYRKNSEDIEALKFNGWNMGIILDWISGKSGIYPACYNETMIVRTFEGDMTANVGDYVIKEANGAFHLCKPNIFKKTYKKIEENLEK